MAKDADIIAISEHALYPCELDKLNKINTNFVGIGVSSKELKDCDVGIKRGHGGCAILWKKTLTSKIRPLEGINSDRLSAIQICFNHVKYCIISVYLPHQSCTISNYEQELAELEYLCNKFSETSSVIVIGDCNAHLDNSQGVRAWGKATKNGKLFSQSMARCDMKIVDTTEVATGPIYTFTSGGGLSYIDHCAVTRDLLSFVSNCRIIEDDILNTSDHLAISVTISVPDYNPSSECVNRRQVAWHKHTDIELHNLYEKPLGEKLASLMATFGKDFENIMQDPDSDTFNGTQEMDIFLSSLNEVIESTSKNLKYTKFSKTSKPYWDSSLSSLSKQQKAARSTWLQAGQPRDPDCQIWMNYKHKNYVKFSSW